MQARNPIVLTILVFAFQIFSCHALVLGEQASVSVITCSPGDEAYSVYGHSAIRVKDLPNNFDMVFNYGIFDFNSSHFLYRFAKGQTDYLLGAYPFNAFLKEYIEDQRSVYEQELNLQQYEKQKIFDFLLWNARPENRVYRYNFFFDNCASRVRDVIAGNVEDGVVYTDKATGKTLRRLIKDYQGKIQWLDFANDFLVGADADRKATLEEEMFLPDYVMSHFAAARRGNNNEPLVANLRVLYQSPENESSQSWLTGPPMVFGILFLLLFVFSAHQYKKQKLGGAADSLIYGLNGLAGMLVLWFVLFSEHPAMNPNYNLMWLLPLNLIFAIIWPVKKWRGTTKYYHLIALVWFVLFIVVSAFLPQKFHPVFYLLVAIFIVRPMFHSISI